MLRSEGYYAYVVEPDVDRGRRRPSRWCASPPGPRFPIADPKVDWAGRRSRRRRARPSRIGASDLTDGAAGPRRRRARRRRPGGRRGCRSSGYADAAAEPREVIVDHADQTVAPDLPHHRRRAGPAGRPRRSPPSGRTNPAWVASWRPGRSGDVYDPDDVAELERRLLDTGVYDSVTVALAPMDKADDRWPAPGPGQPGRPRAAHLELGAGYSTSEGAGFDGRSTRYNRLRPRRHPDADGPPGPDRTAGWRASSPCRTGAGPADPEDRRRPSISDSTDAYDEPASARAPTSPGATAKTSYRDPRRLARPDQTKRQTTANGVPVGAEPRPRHPDHPGRLRLGPLRRPAQPQARLAAGGPRRADPHRSAMTQPAYLRPMTQGIGLSAVRRGRRARCWPGASGVGSIMGGIARPTSRPRGGFYAGGGGSVRGYAYQAVGPRLPDNTPAGRPSPARSLVRGAPAHSPSTGARSPSSTSARVGLDRDCPDAGDFSAGVGLRRPLRPGLRPDPRRHRLSARQARGRPDLPDLPQHRAELLTEPSTRPKRRQQTPQEAASRRPRRSLRKIGAPGGSSSSGGGGSADRHGPVVRPLSAR